ncbi:hypothetical protein [Desmospora activa]|uniref:hypothetical protein n=1 Tax=Desmospora activa TaxID=500615 RepID=UPI001475B4D4|nr:hypothetical protein [Desmospora activa]
MKKYLTALCLLFMVVVQLIGLQTNWGLASWFISFVLLLLAATFTKYLDNKKH